MTSRAATSHELERQYQNCCESSENDDVDLGIWIRRFQSDSMKRFCQEPDESAVNGHCVSPLRRSCTTETQRGTTDGICCVKLILEVKHFAWLTPICHDHNDSGHDDSQSSCKTTLDIRTYALSEAYFSQSAVSGVAWIGIKNFTGSVSVLIVTGQYGDSKRIISACETLEHGLPPIAWRKRLF